LTVDKKERNNPSMERAGHKDKFKEGSCSCGFINSGLSNIEHDRVRTKINCQNGKECIVGERKAE